MSISIAVETKGTQDGVKLRLEPRFVFCDVGFFILGFLLVPLFAVRWHVPARVPGITVSIAAAVGVSESLV